MALTAFKPLQGLAPTLLSVKLHKSVIRSILQVVELAKLFVTAPTNVTLRLLLPPAKVQTVYKPILLAALHGPDVK